MLSLSATSLLHTSYTPLARCYLARRQYSVRIACPFAYSVLGTDLQAADGHVNINFRSQNPEELREQLPPFPSAEDVTLSNINIKPVPYLNVVIQVVGSRGEFFVNDDPET